MKHLQLPLFQTQLLAHDSLCEGISRLSLSLPDGLAWQAGDYVWLGPDDAHLKPFSIASAPGSDRLDIHLAHTEALMPWLAMVTASSSLSLRGPVAQYYWPDGDAPVLLVAGGTGITPFLPMLAQLTAADAARPVTLYWGVRRPELLYVADWLDALAASYPGFRWQAVVSEAETDWPGLTGLLPDVLAQRCPTLSADTRLLCCGPWPMQQAVKQWALALGSAPENIQG